jgi:hypothetical protein
MIIKKTYLYHSKYYFINLTLQNNIFSWRYIHRVINSFLLITLWSHYKERNKLKEEI